MVSNFVRNFTLLLFHTTDWHVCALLQAAEMAELIPTTSHCVSMSPTGTASANFPSYLVQASSLECSHLGTFHNSFDFCGLLKESE